VSTHIVDDLLARIADADERSMRDYCASLIRLGMPLNRLIDTGLAPAMTEVGLLWECGAYSASDEHAATALVEAALTAAAAEVQWHTSRGRVLVACAEGDWHTLPLRMVAEVLTSQGWSVRFLGASQSTGDLLDEVLADRPHAVLLGCAVPTALPALVDAVRKLHEIRIPVYVGGRALGNDARRATAIGADGWAADATGAADLVARRQFGEASADIARRYRQYQRRSEALPSWVAASCDQLASSHHNPAPSAADLRYLLDVASVAVLACDARLMDEQASWLRGMRIMQGSSESTVSRALAVLVEGRPTYALEDDLEDVAELLQRALDMMHLHQADWGTYVRHTP